MALQSMLFSASDTHNLVEYPQKLYCILIGLSVARTLPFMVPFYKWLIGSGLALSKFRGYGQTACGAFGIVPAPKLSVHTFGLAGVVLSASLFALGIPNLPRACVVPLCITALIAYHCYFTQLYPESGTRASVTCLVPMVLMYTMLSPAGYTLNAEDAEIEVQNRAGAFTIWLIKCMMFWGYFAAGVSKVKSSIKARRAWWDGATLQAFVFEAMMLCKPGTHWSYGIFTPFTHEVQKFVFLHRKMICVPLSIATMVIELGAPLTVLLPSSYGSPLFAVLGFSLHLGIAYLQNIDFVSWWGPVYVFFLLDPAAFCGAAPWAKSFLNVAETSCGKDFDLFGIMGSADAAFGIAPVRTTLGLALLTVWICGTIVLHFSPPGLELLPLYRFGMFDVITDVFDPSTPNKIWLSEKRHRWGTLSNYVFGPYYRRSPNIMSAEYGLLPYRYLQMVYGGSDAEDYIIHSNFTLPDQLQHHLQKIRAELGHGVTSDPDAPRRLYQHLRDAQVSFDSFLEEDKISRKLVSDDHRQALDSPLLGA